MPPLRSRPLVRQTRDTAAVSDPPSVPAGARAGWPAPAIVKESALGRRQRRQIGRLLAGEWGAEWRGDAYAGPEAPAFRAVQVNGGGWVTGHVSAFGLRCEPRLRVYGVGDLVVKARYRRLGIARAVCTALVEECWRRGARAVLVDTVHAAPVFGELGFAPPAGFEFYYEHAAACRRHRHWLMAVRGSIPAPVEILSHGDF